MAIQSQSYTILISLLVVSSILSSASLLPKSAQKYLRLGMPLIADNGKVYICSEKNFLAFESNGSIAWTITLNYTCNVGMPPVHGGFSKIYLVAENRVLKISPLNIKTPESAVEVFFGPESNEEEPDEIVGISVSMSSSCVLINVKNRGLFAYRIHGQLLWSAGPVLYQSGYRQGCRKNAAKCYFNSIPAIDHCEASIYMSNTEGELYALSARSPHFKWIQDLSVFDKIFTITPGNNGILYITIPVRALVLALDVLSGTTMWQGYIGPLSSADCAPVVDSNGWVSIGSLDGFLYSFSPTGVLKRFPRAETVDSVIQISPVLDCSGYAVYISQTVMEGKISQMIGEYTYISAMEPKQVVFRMLVPATGSTYWSESYPGSFTSLLFESDLQHFILDERILLAFVTASRIGNPFPCHSTRQKLASSCSQVRPKHISIYTGNERAILLFLLLETIILILLAALARFCCIIWNKRKLQGQDLSKFLERRRSLQLQKKAFDMTITELEQKAAEEAVANEVLEKLGDMVSKRAGVERKLSTTYSLGGDAASLQSRSLLPLYDGKSKSYAFQSAKKESVTIFHTLGDTSSGDSSSGNESDMNFYAASAKAKAPIEFENSSDDEIRGCDHQTSPLATICSSEGLRGGVGSHYMQQALSEPEELNMHDRGQVLETGQSGSKSMRRRTLSSTN